MAYGCVNALGLVTSEFEQTAHSIVHLRVERADAGRLGRFEQFGIGGNHENPRKGSCNVQCRCQMNCISGA